MESPGRLEGWGTPKLFWQSSRDLKKRAGHSRGGHPVWMMTTPVNPTNLLWEARGQGSATADSDAGAGTTGPWDGTSGTGEGTERAASMTVALKPALLLLHALSLPPLKSPVSPLLRLTGTAL